MSDNKGLKEYVLITGLLAICVLGLVMWVTNFQLENSSPINVLNDTSLSALNNTLTTNLSSWQSSAESQRQAFQQENPVVALIGLVSTVIVSSTKVFGNLVLGSVYAVTTFVSVNLGINPLILSIMIGIIIILIILALWRTFRQGE